jgi:hypothetical protein
MPDFMRTLVSPSQARVGKLQLMTWFERSVFFVQFRVPPVAMFIVTETFIRNTAVFLFTTLNI